MAKQAPPVKKNQTISVTFNDLTHEGSGVAKVGYYPIFVPQALPGEEATIKILKVNKKFAYGKLVEVTKASEHRVTPPCKVFYKCGGCQLQHMDYELQLEMKRNQVENVMRKIAHLPDVTIHPTVGMDDPWRYRNKSQIPVGEKEGEIITGFYQERSHRIISDMDTCLIQSELSDSIIEAVRQLANQLQISAYDEEKHEGVLRHIIVRKAYKTDDAMVILVTKTKKLPHAEKIIQALREQFSEINSIIHNVNHQKTNVILGDSTKTIYGEDYIIDSIADLKFKISPQSFFQVNPEQTEKLYNKALEYANVGSEDVVIDAYCGIGSISLFLARQAKKVYGVEVVKEAIADARENAKLNEIDNVEFVVGQAEVVMPKWKEAGINPNVIVVDPPRKGCDESFLQTMLAMKPERIVYVSCNPSTLARDLRILEDGGYRTKEMTPVDMFSQTNHVEVVAWMSRMDG